MTQWKSQVAVLVSYLGLVLLYTWPLPIHIAERVVLARGSDFYPHIWNLWWMRFSLLDLNQNPYHTDYLHFPTGLPLVFHVLDPLNGLLSIPLQAAFGLLAAFNILRLAHLVFSAAAAYALCRTVGLPRWASWAGGALFMLAPVASVSFDLGQLVEISTGWLPLYALCLIRALGNRSLGIAPGNWRWVLGAGISLAASFLSTPYFFIALLLFTGLYFLWEGTALLTASRRSSVSPGNAVSGDDSEEGRTTTSSAVRGLIARAVGVGLLALLLLSPLLIATLRERGESETELSSPLRTVVANSADLLSPFLPAPARLSFPQVNPHGGTAAVSWTVLLLAGVGLLFRRRRAAQTQVEAESGEERVTNTPRSHVVFWGVTALLFMLLALGPRLLVAGNDTGVPMPFALLSQVPFLGLARVPLRFILVSSLALSVLAAFGLYRLSQIRWSPRVRNALATLLIVAVGIEMLGVPRLLFTPTAHPYWDTIKASGRYGGAEGVLELPQGPRTAPAMYAATRHQHPIVGGYTARHYPYPWFDATPGIAQLVDANPGALNASDIVSPPVRTTALAALDYYGVRYVALYATEEPALDGHARDAADLLFLPAGITPAYSDESLTVWRVPPQTREGPIVGLGYGWHGVEGEGTAGDRRWRWTTGDAYVQITNPLEREMPALINLAAYAIAEPRTLLVSLDGNELGRHAIGPHPAQPISISLTLEPGEHWLRLASLEPAERPPGDSRLIGIGFERVEVARR